MREFCRSNSYRMWDICKINATEINTTNLDPLVAEILTLWILRALIFPVCLTWGPRHKSIKGPHLQCRAFEQRMYGLMPTGIRRETVHVHTLLRHSPVNSGGRRGDLLVQNAALEFVVLQRSRSFSTVSNVPSLQLVCGYLKHLQQSFLLDLQPLKRLLFLDDFLAQGLQTGEVVAGYAPVRNTRITRLKACQPKQQVIPENTHGHTVHVCRFWV